ncbi:MAG TPA: bifunctional methylenetetrahydrofolate dehydrogenase/methenyltetrahydrofolate cyclohydrolase FolD [Bryobacteraceae bacterium]|nr:bifunctional methylenetetrahydrofolate dehydrogenase/methenyltetrahydrofolate cyclohydrolase FolD [Bryobacteraceae bacterium]
MPTLLNGNRIRDEILSELKPRVERCIHEGGRKPGLAVVLVGTNPASQIYVRNKVKASEALGLHSVEFTPPATITTDELLGLIGKLNYDPSVDGILVQMPLPPQVESRRILEAISPEKDADGFHPISVGRLVANLPAPRACTPAGVMEILRRQDITVAGKHAVVIGRSDIVGKPMALLLLHANATVTICHSKTPDLAATCSRADILVAAIGRPAFVRREFIKPGATVIDVGINRLANRAEMEFIYSEAPDLKARLEDFDRKHSALVGDVHPLEVDAAGAVTPVPGGVGPLTIAMLMSNTVALAERRLNLA